MNLELEEKKQTDAKFLSESRLLGDTSGSVHAKNRLHFLAIDIAKLSISWETFILQPRNYE